MREFIQSSIEKFYNQSWKLENFLTEDDVRCHLFNTIKKELSKKIKELQNNQSQDSNTLLKKLQNLSVHSEIRWYGRKNNRLKYRSDIVILDKTHIQAEDNELIKLPSKGYRFDIYYTIIEIKLRRLNNKNSDNKYNKIIQTDIDKLKEIKKNTTDAGSDEKLYFMLAFDKKREKKLLMCIDNTEYKNILWKDWSFE